MIKLKGLIKEDCGCGCGGCETNLNEGVTNIDLPQGMEMGKIFTGHGFAFKKEEFGEGTCGYGEEGELDDEPAGPHLIKKKTESTKGGSLPNKAKNVDKVKKVKTEPDDQKGTHNSTDTFYKHHAGSQGSGDMGNQAEPDTYDWDDSGNDANEPGHQTKKNKKKKGYEPVESINELSPRVKKMSDKEMLQYVLYVKKYKPSLYKIMKKDRDIQKLVRKFKLDEGLIDVDKQMKDGTFDERNPQIHIMGYGVMGMKTLGDALSRKLADLAKRAKKGEIENVHSVLNKSGVLQAFVKAYMDAKKQLKSSSMKRKITMYKRKR